MSQHGTAAAVRGPDTVARALRHGFAGRILRPGDAGYDAGRAAWNRRIDSRPLVVAEAAGAGDVRRAVVTAREHGLPFAVRATGHGTYVPADGGLLLRTSAMAAVRVDPYRRVARTGPGALWSEVVAAAAPYGLAPVSGTPAVGVTGYTLGGGAGWLSRRYGFAADNLLRAEVVTAEGDLVVAGADREPELFWALRGGGGNFGVVTALEFRLHPVERVYAGVGLYDARRARATFARYLEWAAGEPDELNTAVSLVRMPALPQVPEPVRGRWALAIRLFHAGGYEDAERCTGRLLAAAGPPLVDGFRAMTFAAAGAAIAGPPPPPMAVRQHFELFHEVPGAVLDAVAEVPREGAGLTAVELRHWGGAMARPEPGAGPVGHRDAPFSIMLSGGYEDGADPAAVDAAVGALAARLRPHATGGSFLNFLADTTRTASAYTPADHARLARLKRVWDPEAVFRPGHDIPPR